jgi:uncharacterized protein (DUF58 family)
MFGWRRKPDLALVRGAATAAAHARHAPHAAEESDEADPERLLRRVEWTVLRRLDGVLQGDYRTLFRGFGLDLADLREYQAHDDVRHMDWNVTARLQVPYVREFQEDREVAAWFLLDLSGSIDFGSRPQRKRMLSAEFVALLSRVLIRYGNRVGAALLADGAHEGVPARCSRRHLLHILERMRVVGRRAERPRAVGGKKQRGAETGRVTDLADLLTLALPLMQRRSVVFVVSDFISAPGWGRALAQLAQRHEVVAVRLFDPMERAMPDLGMVLMQDAETGEQIWVDTHDKGFRRRYARMAEEREELLRTQLADAGVDCLELSTERPVDEAVLRFTQLRKRRSQMHAGGAPAAQPV